MNEQDEIKQYGQLVAKAWGDPAFKEQLLADPAGTLRAEGFTVREGMQMRVLEPSGPRLYMPLPAEMPAGEQPSEWATLVSRAQAEPAFRARLVAEPEAVLAEQGIELPADVPVEVAEVSDTRGYIAVPPAPEGLDADSLGDVAGYFSCNYGPPPSEAVPQKTEGPTYFRPWYDARGGSVTPWKPIWTAPQGIAASLRPLS